jgi:TRAP-type mannitol/chloroaromatic compound transport system substrate-binding protein
MYDEWKTFREQAYRWFAVAELSYQQFAFRDLTAAPVREI